MHATIIDLACLKETQVAVEKVKALCDRNVSSFLNDADEATTTPVKSTNPLVGQRPPCVAMIVARAEARHARAGKAVAAS
jgi:hypothetical protein